VHAARMLVQDSAYCCCGLGGCRAVDNVSRMYCIGHFARCQQWLPDMQHRPCMAAQYASVPLPNALLNRNAVMLSSSSCMTLVVSSVLDLQATVSAHYKTPAFNVGSIFRKLKS
jgi:hypothetical protein